MKLWSCKVNRFFSEKLTIEKDDSTLTKLTKYCVWFSVIVCFLVFAIFWLLFFFILGFFTGFWKLLKIAYLHHKRHKYPLH